MADVHSKETRSYTMSKVKSKNTKPEIIVRKFLFKKGFRYRLHLKKLPGKPDIVLLKYKTVIFINGYFWHGHDNCHRNLIPKSNAKYWHEKVQSNINRDNKNQKDLQVSCWNVIVIWECNLNRVNREATLKFLVSTILASATIKS